MTPQMPVWREVDPFDLPDWLGERDVTWRADKGLTEMPRVTGRLSGGDDAVQCDLLAVDEAYPRPVADDETRRLAHQAWRHGQVLLGQVEERLTLLVPGCRLDPQQVLETLGRLAKAVGAPPGRYSAHLVVGDA